MYFDIIKQVKLSSKEELHNVCRTIEANARTQPDKSAINIRIALEMLTRSLLLEHGFTFPKNKTAEIHKLNNMINQCRELNIIDETSMASLHVLRKKANSIVHTDYKQEGAGRYSIKDKHTSIEEACSMTIQLYGIVADVFHLKKEPIKPEQLPIDGYEIVQIFEKSRFEAIWGEYNFIGKKTELGIEQYTYIRPFQKNTFDYNKTFSERDAAVLLRIKKDKAKCPNIVAGAMIIGGEESLLMYVAYDIYKDTMILSRCSGTFSAKNALRIALDLTEGLLDLTKLENVMHHRSIRPEYIFITPMNNGCFEASLGCFENAKIESAAAVIETVLPQYQLRQKDNFFAPFEIRSKSLEDLKNADWEKVDVYSLAAILAYCLDKESVKEKVDLMIFDEYFSDDFSEFMEAVLRDPLAIKPGLSEFHKMLKEEEKRFE